MVRPLPPTPSQTVGPFFGYALTSPSGGEIAPPDHPDAVVLRGTVYDGAGLPVPDALVELWQGGSFGRIATDADGTFVARIAATPYISVCVFARGLLHHLFTRAYLSAAALDATPALATLPNDRRSTLLAQPEQPGVYRFDIRLQGDEETVFLEFH
jgi:protocatechuate 3,4-dioxygenase, alpha subunit